MANLAGTGFSIGDWQVLPAEGVLSRADEVLRLEPKVMEVLVYLASRPGEVITREELERDVWRGAIVGYDSVTATVIKLRKALQDNAKQPRFIATIPKRGYQLIASVSYPGHDDDAGISAPVFSESIAKLQQPPRSIAWTGIAMVALVSVFISSLVWLWLESPPANESNVALPSIIVLPFENPGNQPEHEYLVDGITEDIITDLSRLSSLQVISSNTSFTYKGRQPQVQDIGTELKVDFVLKGHIRQFGDAVRVNVQLVNAVTGFNIWAARYDRKAIEIFMVQDEVTNSIVETLAVKLTRQEKQRLAKRTTENLAAYDFFQQGQRISKIGTKETSEQARTAYRKAIELDPAYGRAYGAVAYTLAFDFRRGWTDSPLETLDRALEMGKKAVVLDDSIPQTHWALAYAYLMRQEYAKAEKAALRAVAVAPSYADGYGLLALISNNVGQPEKAIEYVTRGMRLNPYYTWDYLFNLGRAYYTIGRYDDAIDALAKAQERNENAMPVRLFLAASYVRAGRQDDAEWEAVQIQTLNPAETIAHTEKTIPIVSPQLKKTFLDDLRKAGLPE